MGGLITNCNPQDLPEGASPRTWDTDYIIGSVFTRAGLDSVYVFTQTLVITQVIVYNGVATFTYTGTTPVVNEQFILSGFTGSAFGLNGQVVTVLGVGVGTFTAITTFPTGVYAGLSGTATSLTGSFSGPNPPQFAMVTGTGNTWQNPTGILGNLTYASVAAGLPNNAQQIPTTAANLPNGGQIVWSNPTNVTSTLSYATITLAEGQTQEPLVAYNGTISLPVDATVTGIKVTLQAYSSVFGVGSLNVQLTDGDTLVPYGTLVNIPIGTNVGTSYAAGSSSYQWGTSLSPDNVNSSELGVQISAVISSGTATVHVNNLVITVYYVLAGSTTELQTTDYVFSIPLTSGITGFVSTFQAYTNGSSEVIMQLLKNGIAVGTPRTQILTTTPTVYSLGADNDLWGSTWLASDVNNIKFGLQITASGIGTTFVNDLDLLTYITPALVNFNYIKSYVQNTGQTYTMALDASGILWREDVTNNPGTLAIALTGILPGSFAKSVTMNSREFIVFSDLSVGTERPRVYNGVYFGALSAIGPGAPPAFTAASGTGSGNTLTITNFQITNNVVTFTYMVGPTVTQDQVYTITGATPTYLNFTGTVLSTGLTATTFEMDLPNPHADVASTPISPSATGTLQFNYPLSSITQPAQQTITDSGSGTGAGCFWGAGPGPTHTAGSNFVVYYSQTQDLTLTAYFNAHQTATYVYLGSITNFPQFSNQTYLVTSIGSARPSSTAGANRFYFVVNVGVSGLSYPNGTTGTYQQTIATVTTTNSVPGLIAGTSVRITGETPTAWNNTWTIIEALSSATVGITSTRMSASGTATYTYTVPVGGVQPVNGQTISVTGCTNSGAGYTTSPFNLIANIVVPGSSGPGSFDITGFTSGLPITLASENGVGETFGKNFTIDPGTLTLGTAVNPIYGNAGSTSASTGLFFVSNPNSPAIGTGTRQGVVFFIYESGYETTPSYPVVFTVPENATSIQVTNIPIGPPNVVARGIALTEAGQNGVPGSNFYVIEEDVVVQVQNGSPITYKSTIVKDNVSTSATLTFSDSVLLESREIDVQGDNLFNLIELGSSGWDVAYAGRMFYGLQLNKINNWTSGGGLTFDGGFLPSATGGNILPLGWQSPQGVNSATLITSTVTGQSLYISNTTGAVIHNAGLVFQTAFVDKNQVPIIDTNTMYSVRVAARCPSGVKVGTLTLTLSNYNQNNTTPDSQLFPVWGSFTVPLSSMTTNMQVFTGPLLTTAFTGVGGVPSTLTFSVQVVDLGVGADCEIDRIEVYVTKTPFLKTQVYGSYPGQPESIDASATGGVIDTTSENAQPCMGAFVLRDLLFLLKTNSMYSTQDNPNSEPGGWGLHEVSNTVGTIGINSYDVGEEWMVTACRSGIFGFNGGQPTKIMQELWNLWEQINWNAGNTIVLRNDIVNKRMYCAIPLPTGVNPATNLPANILTIQWLPNAPYNPTPTTPNVMLMLNYQGLATFEEMINSPQVHTTIKYIVLSIA